jgi:methyl-accepting chemotaxis protein
MDTQIQELEKKHAEEIGKIRHDVNQMRQELSNTINILKDENFENNKRIDRLLTLLEGDPMDKDRGLIPRLKTIEDFVGKMKDTKSYLAGNIAAAVFFITAVGGILSICYKIYLFLNNK